MLISRAPRPALRPFVESLWFSRATREVPRERVLPSGAAHLVVRLSDHSFRIDAESVGWAAVAGPRSTFYEKETPVGACAVGAQLRPGALALLTGVPAHELANRHTPWVDLAPETLLVRARERMAEATTVRQALVRWDAFLAAQLPVIRAMHPAVAHALGRFVAGDAIAPVVRASGFSHRRFIALFESEVGLSPKLYCRVRRFDAAVARVGDTDRTLAELALDGGFADQPHLNREFRAFAGCAPGAYRRMAPSRPGHLLFD